MNRAEQNRALALEQDVEPDVHPLSALALANIVLRQRRLIVLVTLPLLALAVAGSLALPRWYTSTATFIPTSQRAPANVSGLASQLGMSLGPSDATQSPAFYSELITSRQILDSVAAHVYAITVRGRTRNASLADWYRVEIRDPALRSEAVLRRLRDDITVKATASTGIVRISVASPHAELSRQIADQSLRAVIAFNSEQRRTRASADREFAESQLVDAYARLRAAEDQLQAFLTTNREYRLSPRLTFDYDRLARNVGMRQELYNAIARAYEQAKIDALRDAQTITIIEQPSRPVRPTGRKTVRRTLAALFVGVLVGVTLALLREYLSRSRSTFPSAAEEFRALRREALSDLRRPWRLVRSAETVP